MPNIQVLDPHVADLIAAGEVVERPASVVKELMENAFDAGARAITVEIENGGMSMIRVTDDGCGIPADQAETAFLRHATSKLRQAGDLEAIGTLGFRGEALAAICAVSRVELLTRTAEETLGVSVSLEGGKVMEREEAGCPAGTTMIVRDLFFNTPARLKFMKRDQAEGAAVFAVVQRQALAHPDVSVKFFRDGRQDLLTPGDGTLKSTVYAVFGRDIALGFLPVKGSGEGIAVEGFVSMPVCCRGSRNYQNFFVNGRYVKSLAMQAAVEEAYKNQKMVGKFPGCVLHLTVKLGSVDVNVHPAKTEVKFSAEGQVFSSVYHTVLDALEADHSRPRAEVVPSRVAQTVQPPQTLFRPAGSGQSQSFREAHVQRSPARLEPVDTPPVQHRSAEPAVPRQASGSRFVLAGRGVDITPPERGFDVVTGTEPAPETRDAPLPEQELPSIPPAPATRGEPPPKQDLPPNSPVSETRDAPPPVQDLPPVPRASVTLDAPPPTDTLEPVPPAPVQDPNLSLPLEGRDWTVRGELFHTYILVEQGEKVLLIDKHAAHERMNFDRLKAADWRPLVQQLLTPVVFSPAPEEKAALLAQSALLEEYGFAVEDFGASALAVSEAPDDIPAGEIAATLEELARRILTTGSADPAGARDELLHTMACKAAIKGGWRTAREELEVVAEAVMSGQVKYCPHGRPVAIELTQRQLEKQFKRV